MTSDWFKLTLGDVCEKITDGAHKSPKSVDDGKPMASVKDLTRFGVDLSNARKISKEDFDDLVQQGCKPHVGDVLIAKDGNSALDTVCTVDSEIDAVLLSSVAILRPDPEMLDSNFLKYYFCSPQVIDYLKTNFISGAAIPRVVLRDFRKAEINIPPLSIQRKISQCLSSIDNKIFSNTQTNQTLEQMAQAIFKSWFVDFDPVKAKMNGEQPEGMDAVTASLFPEKLVESELGLIPEGWKIQNTGDLFDVKDGTHDSPKKAEEGHYLVTSKHITGGKIDTSSAYLISDADFEKVNQRSKVDTFDILLTMIGTVGEVVVVYDNPVEFAIKNVGLFKTSQRPELVWLFYWHLQSFKMKNYLEVRMAGTTQQYLTLKTLRTIPVILPSEDLLTRFNEMMSPLMEKISDNHKQNHTLSSLRDTLLPKLLSGEIDLAETTI